MKDILKGLQPELVFKNFETLTKIPRGSGNEKAVSDYLVSFAKGLNLEVTQDKSLNVIIKKPGTKGHEKSKNVILQGHMDMVCVKKDDIEFDFEKDAIPILVDKDMIKTKGTTLGADNGIAVSMSMAILESKELEHPPLTVLITVEEETGMGGVKHLDKNAVNGDILINLDSEEEGVFLASCAGGARNVINLPIEYKDLNKELDAYEISISGLLGGHSGAEIDKNRGNAIKLMGRLLDGLNEAVGIDISNIIGGEKMNAIPKMAKSIVLIDKQKFNQFKETIDLYQQVFTNEYKVADPEILLTFKKIENSTQVINDTTKNKLIAILRLIPCGVQTMSSNIKGLVESSNNIGILEMKDKEIIISSAIRSSVRSLKYEINNRIKFICELVGATMELVADYPAWEYKENSPIRELMLKVYKQMYKSDAEVKAIHAGLECGYLKEKIGDIDMISMGPNIYDVHTPEEHISISSIKKVYEFLCEVLRNC